MSGFDQISEEAVRHLTSPSAKLLVRAGLALLAAHAYSSYLDSAARNRSRLRLSIFGRHNTDDTDSDSNLSNDDLPVFRQKNDWNPQPSTSTAHSHVLSPDYQPISIPGATLDSDFSAVGPSKVIGVIKGDMGSRPSTSTAGHTGQTGGRELPSHQSTGDSRRAGVPLARQTSRDRLKEDVSTDSTAVGGAFSRDINMEVVNGLTLVTTPMHSMYTESSLESVITQLLSKIANDDTSEEFKQLRALNATDNCEAARSKENKIKNRFRNVVPYDATRVLLNNEEDYINANHIQKAMGKDCFHYIASQGPLPHTTGDYWEMIMEQGVTMVAMVTKDVEGGKVKCHRYWPDSLHTSMVIEDTYEVTLHKVMHMDDFDVRHLEVKDMETLKTQRLVHMNYTKWPDHGVPESAVPLLQYIRLMHELHSGGPTLVHCSAGIGRTGTLITLDLVLSSIEYDLKFDIHEIVTELRRQRPGMIQTKHQYLFCYTATLEVLESLRTKQKASLTNTT